MVSSEKSEAYLIDKNGKLLNKFELHKLLNQKNKKSKISILQTNKFLKLNNLDNIYNSIDKCKDFVGESIPVTLNNGKLVGIITEGDLFQIFLKVSSEEKELENRD